MRGQIELPVAGCAEQTLPSTVEHFLKVASCENILSRGIFGPEFKKKVPWLLPEWKVKNVIQHDSKINK